MNKQDKKVKEALAEISGDTSASQIAIIPIKAEQSSDKELKALLQLQLKMATSSINHEYASMEFEHASCRQRKEELLDYMTECRDTYLEARGELESFDKYALEEFERDLLLQKKQTLNQFNAWEPNP